MRPSATAPKLPSPFLLAPNDWILPPGYRVANLFFYARPDGVEPEEFLSVSRLQDALQIILDAYPLLHAVFTRNDSNGTIELDLESEKCGVPFVIAEAPCTLESLPLTQQEYTSTRVLPASLKLVHDFNYAAALAEPALAIQHTRFACGGVCIGAHMHHILGDASSFFQLMADWVRAYNDPLAAREWLAANPPTIDRSMFRWGADEVAARMQGHEEDGYLVPSSPPPGWTPGPPNIARVFLFGAEELRAMKDAAMPPKESDGVAGTNGAGMVPKDADGVAGAHGAAMSPQESDVAAGTNDAAASGNDRWVSTMEALSAHTLRCVFMARNPDAAASASVACASDASGSASASSASDHSLAPLSQAFLPSTLKFHIATNWRPRLRDPPPPPRFFGNGALYTPVLLADPLALVRNNLAQNASLVHRALLRNDSRHLRGTMAWITSQPLRSAIIPNFHLSGCRDFAITAWHRFGAYGDAGTFGGSVPVRVCQPSFQGMDGVAILMPGRAKGAAAVAASGAAATAGAGAVGAAGAGSSVSSLASPSSLSPNAAEGESIEMILGLTEEAMARLESSPEWRKFRPRPQPQQ